MGNRVLIVTICTSVTFLLLALSCCLLLKRGGGAAPGKTKIGSFWPFWGYAIFRYIKPSCNRKNKFCDEKSAFYSKYWSSKLVAGVKFAQQREHKRVYKSIAKSTKKAKKGEKCKRKQKKRLHLRKKHKRVVQHTSQGLIDKYVIVTFQKYVYKLSNAFFSKLHFFHYFA